MFETHIPIVLLHQSAPRMLELSERFAGLDDFSVIATLATTDELAHTPGADRAIVLTDAVAHNGIPLADRVRTIRATGARVVVLAGADFPAGVVPAMAAGADAVLPPKSSSRRIAEQMRLVANRARLMDDPNAI